MSDVRALRREARIRKILENSEDRLRKITGNEEDKSKHDNGSLTTKSSLHGDCKHPVSNSSPGREPNLNLHIDSLITEVNDINDTAINTNFPNALLPTTPFDLTPSTPSTPGDQIVSPSTTSGYNKQLLITIIAVVFSFSLAIIIRLTNDDTIIAQMNTIFAPLLLFELYDLVFTPTRQLSSGSTLHSFVLFFSQQRGSNYVKIATILLKFGDIINDVFIYFFVYMVCNFFIRVAGYVV